MAEQLMALFGSDLEESIKHGIKAIKLNPVEDFIAYLSEIVQPDFDIIKVLNISSIPLSLF
jgi:hypothetical protein